MKIKDYEDKRLKFKGQAGTCYIILLN